MKFGRKRISDVVGARAVGREQLIWSKRLEFQDMQDMVHRIGPLVARCEHSGNLLSFSLLHRL